MNNFKRLLLAIVATGFALVALPFAATALVIYPPGALLQPGDVTSSIIRDGTIVGADLNNTASFTMGGLTATNATTTNATTTSLAVSGSSLSLNGVVYTTPSADGTNGQTLTTNGAKGLSWTTASGTFLASSYTAGETLAAGNPVFMASTTNYIAIANLATTNDGVGYFGKTDGVARGQTFSSNDIAYISGATVFLEKVGTPTDNVTLTLESTAAGAPADDSLATATTSGAALTASCVGYTFALSAPVSLTAATSYAIVLGRSGAASDVNYYNFCFNDLNPYANGSTYTKTAGVWGITTGLDFQGTLGLETIAGDVYKTRATLYDEEASFIGFAQTTIASSSAGKIIHTGEATNLSGLSAGRLYYLGDTRGSLSTAAGTITRKACIASSATTCVVTNEW